LTLGLVTSIFCSVEGLNKLNVFQERNSRVVVQTSKNIIFELLKFGVVVSDLLDTLNSVSLEISILKLDDNTKALFFQGKFCNTEINDSGCLGNHITESGVRNFSCQNECGLGSPLHSTLSNLDLSLLGVRAKEVL
jgi:hypothetical protein